MSFLMGYVAGMATSSSRNSSRHNFEEERLKTKCKELEQQIKRLQEQLHEANELLKAYGTESLWESLSLSCDEANEYCKKWGVK